MASADSIQNWANSAENDKVNEMYDSNGVIYIRLFVLVNT